MSDETDESFLDWDDWVKLSDKQQDAIIDREMAEHNRMLNALSFRDQIAYHRRRVLENLVNQRRLLRTFNFDFMRERLKESQIRLLKLRIWRSTGTYPGEA